MRPYTQQINLSNQSATLVALAQQIASAGNLTLTANAANIDSSGSARILLLTTTENDSGVNYTIVGLDADGNSITETGALPNNTTKSSTKAYASVSKISLSAGITANMSVGTVNSTLTAYSTTIPLDFYARTGASAITEITGTIVYTVQETFDDLLGQGSLNAIWYDGSLSNDTQNTSGGGTVGANLLALSSVNGRSQLDKGATGVRIKIISYSNGATLKLRLITEANTDMG